MTDVDYCLLKEHDFVSEECIFSCFHQGQRPLFLLESGVGRAPSGVGAELLVQKVKSTQESLLEIQIRVRVGLTLPDQYFLAEKLGCHHVPILHFGWKCERADGSSQIVLGK